MDHLFKGSSSRRADAVKSLDWSHDIATDPEMFAFHDARDLTLPGEVTAMAHDPLQSLMAVGTAAGTLHVYGAPAVSLTWANRPAHQLKHLAFHGSLLCCVDVKDTLNVYDLAEIEDGAPFRSATHSVRSSVTCIETSPAHSHLFLGLKDGTVDCYDLDRGISSPYRIPNLWLEQEECLRRSGVPGAPSRRHIPFCTDVKIHPRDLNLLLIAYEGGIALWSILAKSSVRIYELVIPPGAIGGGNTDPAHLFEERRPNVVCLAFRHDGLVFASGHEDGCIAFWALEDGDRPLAVRTLDRDDVLSFDWSENDGQSQDASHFREPIFRLAWSGFPEDSFLSRMTAAATSATQHPQHSSADPGSPVSPPGASSSGTMLCVMGGLLPSDPTGVHVLHFPAYEAPVPSWQAQPTGSMPEPLRQSLQESTKATGHSIYFTSTPPEDFLLLPRSNPFFGGAFDPTAIVISTSEDPNLPPMHQPFAARGLRAFTYPPSLVREPTELRLPAPLELVGPRSVVCSAIVELPLGSYRRLLYSLEAAGGDEHACVPLHGGRAAPADGVDPRILKMDRRRVWVTAHLDLSIRFWDMSAQLLLAETPALQQGEADPTGSEIFAGRIKHAYPRLLHHLTLDLRAATALARGAGRSALIAEGSAAPTIRTVELGAENLELAVVLDNGSMILCRLEHGTGQESADGLGAGMAPPEEAIPADEDLSKAMSSALDDLSLHHDDGRHVPSSAPVPRPKSPTKPARPAKSVRRTIRKSSRDNSGHSDVHIPLNELEVFDMSTLAPVAVDSYRPFALVAGPHPVEKVVVSDIGFVAAGAGGFLYIVDLRGPELVFAENVGEATKKGKAGTKVATMRFVVSDIAHDRSVGLRLLVACDDGSLHVITLTHGLDIWIARRHAEHSVSSQDSLARPIALFSFDMRGVDRTADGTGLQFVLTHQDETPAHPDSTTSLGVIVSASTISLLLDSTGSRVSKADFGEEIAQAGLVRQFGAIVLVVVSRRGTRYVIALPSLGLIRKVAASTADSHSRPTLLGIDSMGDALEFGGPLHVKVTTSIAGRQVAYAPSVQPHSASVVTPAAPTNGSVIASTFASWFGGKPTVATGDAIDAALAGPKRPEKKLRQPPAAKRHAVMRAAPGFSGQQQRQGTLIAGVGARDQLAHNADALDERGDRLKFLEDTMNDVGNAATDMVSQARRIAARESTKSTFSSGVSGVKNFFM